jgi:hypothetical protein
MDAKTNVEAGVARLDAQYPDWAQKIDVDELRMNDCNLCILGQLYGDFNRGLVKLVPDPEDSIDAVALGFDEPWDNEVTYAELQEEWEQVIQHRQEPNL